LDGENVGLISAHQVLELPAYDPHDDVLSVLVLSDRFHRYGLVVDRFLGEHDLAVRPLDPRLGKVKDISAATLMENGTPVLILDVDDLVLSMDNLLSGGRLRKVTSGTVEQQAEIRKRVLVVDDSITVREVERKLLENRGYEVDVAVDGMEGWNAVRAGHYDLVISDLDMPRMNGIELVTRIKHDQRLKTLPVMIVSYKDREEDRMAGLEAGANTYLTKSGFHDETLVRAVIDLIGEAKEHENRHR
jgi:two-component system sensor histidine kinase and response regulator WspE